MHLRIGIANATKELDVDVADAEAVLEEYRHTLEAGEQLLSIQEQGGGRTVVSVAAILYFGVEPPERPGIGFAPHDE